MALAPSPGAAAASPTSGKSRPLMVPAADVLAKNMRALENLVPTSPSPNRPFKDTVSPTLLMGLGASNESARQHNTRFQRASSSARSNPLVAVLLRLFSSASKKDKSDTSAQPANAPEAPPLSVKIAIPLEKAAGLISRLPDPLILFLSLTLAIMLADRFRPHWLHHLAARIVLPLVLFLVLVMAALWRKTELFVMMRERRVIFTHPAELRLDTPEADIALREQRLRAAEEVLHASRDKLDALRKELGKEGNVVSADGIIMPSRKAAEMIADGALGAGFDAATAAEVEQRRKDENVRRCREEWRMRSEHSDDDREQMKLDLRLLADHAAAAYTKRTRELKNRSTTAAGGNRAEKLLNLKKMMQTAAARNLDDETRVSRYSERSIFGSTAGQSTVSRKRVTLLGRRKRRGTAPNLDGRLTMSESGGRGVSQSDV